MDPFAYLAAGFTALVAQWLNRRRGIPTEVVKGVLFLSGLPFFAWANGLPLVWWGPIMGNWLTGALVWCCAIPGLATMVSNYVPGMKSDSQP